MNYSISKENEIIVIKLEDEKVGYPGLEEFQQILNAKIDEGEKKLLLDLASVKFLDSFGIGILVGAHRKLSGQGGTLKLSGVNDRIMMSLTITRLDKMLEIHDDLPSALDSFA
ncbi:STAS domain-containing protein [Acidobacteriota bacterium]